MIKTIKVKKQLRLDELIKYVWENNEIFKWRTHIEFTSNSSCTVIFDDSGYFETDYGHDSDETFSVEVEEPITEDTEFEALVFILVSGRIEAINNYHSIRSARSLFEKYETEKQIYAVINKKLELIWEADSE